MSSFFTRASTRSTTPKLRSGKTFGEIYNWFPRLPFSNRRKTGTNELPPSPEINITNDEKGEANLKTPQEDSAEIAEKSIPIDKGPIEIKPKNGQPPKIVEELNAIIPISVKQKQAFKNELAYLTRSDAHHDLGELFKDTMYKKEENIRKAYDSGIPVKAEVAFHEGDALASVIISATDANGATINIHTGNNQQEEYLKEALEHVPDCTQAPTPAYSSFAIGVGGETIFKYRVVGFVTQCSNNSKIPGLEAKACKTNFGQTFFNNTKLGEDGNEAAIIVDFSQHHFMENLSSGDPDKSKTIYYLMTPEVINDPAGKPNVNNKNLFGVQNKGISLNSWVQRDPEPITYTKYNPNEPSTANNFFSNYTFELSPVKQIFTGQKAEKLIATLNISYDGGDGKPLTDTIEDSKGENSITTVLGYLKKILAQIQGTGGSPIEKFNFNSKIQQKRGGDWFQALSCLTAKNRNYTQILPVSDRNNKSLPPTCPVYLVTHDRIAVAFALLNGVNVIYLDYYGRIFIFKNGGDPTLKSSGKSMEEILFDGIKANWAVDSNGNRQLSQSKNFMDVITTATAYKNARYTYIQEETAMFNTTCAGLITAVSAINTSNFEKSSQSNLQNLFTNAVKLAFANLNLIDIDNDLNIVNNKSNQAIFTGDYNPDNSTLVASFSKALNNLKGIKDRYGNIATGQESSFKDTLTTWVASNALKLDVYKVANKVLYGLSSESESFSLDRLMSIFSKDKTDERKTDIHIFLPFIQILSNDNKSKIIDVINLLVSKTSIYYTEVVTKARAGRSGISSQRAYYNGIANLLYESFLFLKPSERIDNSQRASAIGGGVVFEIGDINLEDVTSNSTDNIVLKEDYDDLKVMKTTGKNSANTEDAQEGGGTYIDNFSGTNARENVISDVSVKQITWPLISVSLIDKSSIPSLVEFLKGVEEHVINLNKTTIDATIDEAENEEMLKSILDKLNSILELMPQANRTVILQKMASEGIKQNIEDVVKFSNFLLGLLDRKKGGGDSSPPTLSKDLMKDFNFGFHPLTPIYAMLTSYYNIICHKSQSDPFFYTYFTYINVLEKMQKVLEEKYLDNTIDSTKSASAYMIGLGLYNMLFASHTSIIQHNTILQILNMEQSDYSEFSLKNDCFASTFLGSILQTPEEEIIGSILVNNPLFNNFINNEVNIKQILELGTPVENLPDYTVLKDRMFKLMGEIVVKVNADRGTPIGAQSSLASGITAEEPVIEPTFIKEQKDIASGLAVKPYASISQQYYKDNVKKSIFPMNNGLQYRKDFFPYSTGNEFNMPAAIPAAGGGKRSKRYINKKRKITKRKKGDKLNKNKTIKRRRVYRRTRKH
jgi:hypothetical protein